MILLQSIRFRIILACISFSIIVTLCYGMVVFYGLKWGTDELFNWQISQEASLLIEQYQQQPQRDLSQLTTANVFVSDERQALANIAEYFQSPDDRQAVLSASSLENIALPGPIFTTPQGYVIFEIIGKVETLHVLKKAQVNAAGDGFFYIVDITDFVNYDDHSEQELVTLFIKMLLLILAIGLLLGLVIAKMVVAPLSRLAKSVESVKPGQPLQQPERYFNDEIGYLANKLDEFVTTTLEFVDREKAFSRDCSHELRTPLASSRAALELALSTDVGQSDPMHKFLQRIYRSNKNMSHLIETFLLLGRDDSVSEKVTFNLYELVQQSFNKHDYLKTSDAVACINKVSESAELQQYQQYLSIVIDNIVRNALQHTHEGAVTVSYSHQRIVIEDTGDGIDFNNNATDKPGLDVWDKSGLGLAIVRRLCDKQGWQLTLTSELGLGTQVSIQL